MTSKTNPAMLPFPTTLIVVKGCPALNIGIREHWTVKEVRELGPDYSHFASIVIERGGKTMTFEVRHVNRLNDPEFNAQRWQKTVRFARGPQDTKVRFVRSTPLSSMTGEIAPKVWEREAVPAA